MIPVPFGGMGAGSLRKLKSLLGGMGAGSLGGMGAELKSLLVFSWKGLSSTRAIN